MKKVVLILCVLILVMLVSSYTHQQERKTILIFGGNIAEEIETLNGTIKELSNGDSVSMNNFYHVYFNKKGDMVRSNLKYKSYGYIVYYNAFYSFLYNKKKKKIAMTAKYTEHGNSGSSRGISKWKIDTSGQIATFDWDAIKHNGTYVEFKYGKSGHLLYKDVYNKLDIPDRYFYKYDANNRLIELEAYQMVDNHKEQSTFLSRTDFKYISFDSHNNWIKKSEHIKRFMPYVTDINHTPADTTTFGKDYRILTDTTFTITRKITYY